MADLSDGFHFTPCSSKTGALELTWPAFDAAELHVWVLLLDPLRLDPADLHPERLLANLIRVPVASHAGRAIVYVPTFRALGATLVARDAQGQLALTPTFTIKDGPPPARTAAPEAPHTPPPAAPGPSTTPPPAATATAPRPAPTSPTAPPGITRARPPEPAASATTSEGRRIPLVFARAGATPPPITSGRPALRSPTDDVPTSFDALRARVASLAALTPAPPPAPEGQATAGFGVRQRFTLTRLSFPPHTPGAPRVLVAQNQFIGRSDLESWRDDPPSWAFPVPDGCDGLVDGLSPEDQHVFYALLVRTESGWLPQPLTPCAPPFTDILRPLILGDAQTRLEAALAQDPAPALAELLQQALTTLAPPEGPA